MAALRAQLTKEKDKEIQKLSSVHQKQLKVRPARRPPMRRAAAARPPDRRLSARPASPPAGEGRGAEQGQDVGAARKGGKDHQALGLAQGAEAEPVTARPGGAADEEAARQRPEGGGGGEETQGVRGEKAGKARQGGGAEQGDGQAEGHHGRAGRRGAEEALREPRAGRRRQEPRDGATDQPGAPPAAGLRSPLPFRPSPLAHSPHVPVVPPARSSSRC